MSESAATVEQLLTHATWLRGLACRLVGEAGADDLVQEVWLRTSQRPPERLDSPRGWLKSVARSVHLRWSQRGAAAQQRERAVAVDEALPSTAELTARAEVERQLAEAVLQLPENYRRVLLLHFFEGYSAAELGRRYGEPASTVRNRIARGLQQLRDRLDSRPGGRESWISGIALLVAPKSGASGLLALTVWSVAMWKSVAAIVTLALFAWLGAVLLDAPAEPPARLVADGAPPPAGAALEAEPAPQGPDVARAEAALPLDGAAPAQPALATGTQDPAADEFAAGGPGTLRVRVLRGDQPVAGHWVHVRSTYSGPWLPTDLWSEEKIRHCRLDQAGLAVFDGLTPDAVYTVGVEIGVGRIPMTNERLPETEGSAVTIRLGTATVQGRVRDDAGAPIVDAEVRARTVPWHRGPGIAVRTDAAGRYAIRDLLAGETELEVHLLEPGAKLGSRTMQIEDGQDYRWDLGGTALTHWTGTVRNTDGQPALGGCNIRCVSADGTTRAFEIANDGTFSIEVTPGETAVRVLRLHRQEPALEATLSLPAGAWVEDLTIPGRRLTAEVRRRVDGSLVPEGELRARYPSARKEGGNGSSSVVSGQVVGPGRFVVDGLAPGRWLMQCNGEEANVLVEVREGERPDSVALWLR